MDSNLKERIVYGALGVVLILFLGSTGYFILGHGKWDFSDCMYMTAITLSTVGYGEIIDVGSIPGARIYTIVLILFGMGIIGYLGSMIVAVLIEGELKQFFRRRRMEKNISKLENHFIVCGAGTTGMYIIKELISTKSPMVVIDMNEERIKTLILELNTDFPYVIGDASEDYILEQAGIKQAKGLITSLPEDKDNLFVVITARQLNPKLRIISRGIEIGAAQKLKIAGADSVISPNLIGGMRMASEMLRPKVVEFLDVMLKDTDKNLRIEEAVVPPDSSFKGKTLGEINLRKFAQVLIVAVKDMGGKYYYNPGSDYVLNKDTTLIVLGPTDEVIKLREFLRR